MKRLASLRPRFSLRAFLLAVTLLPPAGYYWATIPQRTWNAFLRAVERGEPESINAYCDPQRLQFSDSEQPELTLIIEVRKPPSVRVSRFTSFDELKGLAPAERSFVDFLLGRQRMGTRGSILFGQLEVNRSRVTFKPD